jgi:tetraacyldisaccharide 4'-kinase
VDGVVVVSDGSAVRAGLDESGDEPLMLARQVPGAAVCVSPNRYLAGTLAETTLGCTVHVLDDGFQHLELARDLDVLVTTLGEIPGGRVLPMGRLREPIDAASRAHVLVVSDANAAAAAAEAWTLGISQACGMVRELREPILVGSATPDGSGRLDGKRVLAVAGIAHPERFADSLGAAGWQVAGLDSFPDHHRYTLADVARISAAAARASAGAVFTTDKDAVRFDALGPLPFALFRVPLAVRFEPEDVLFGSVREMLRRRAAGEDGA